MKGTARKITRDPSCHWQLCRLCSFKEQLCRGSRGGSKLGPTPQTVCLDLELSYWERRRPSKLAWWHSVTTMVLLRLKFCHELTMSYRILWGWKLGSLAFHVVAGVIRDTIYDIYDMINPNWFKQNVTVRLWDLAWGTFCQEHAEYGPVEARAGQSSMEHLDLGVSLLMSLDRRHSLILNSCQWSHRGQGRAVLCEEREVPICPL